MTPVHQDRELPAIWEMRNSGQTIEAREALALWLGRRNARLGPTPSVMIDALVESGTSTSEAFDAALLAMSFERAKLNMAVADQMLRQILDHAERLGHEPDHVFHFQSGLNAMVNEFHAKALDHFLTARGVARSAREYHLAYFNAILCLENLGHDLRTHVRSFEASFALETAADWAREQITPQMTALRVRCCYRFGALDDLAVAIANPELTAQSRYLARWLRQQPLLCLGEDNSVDAVPENVRREYVFPYRERTLQALLLEDDLRSDVRTADQIERFYLWTWRWLTNPDLALTQRLERVRARLERDLATMLAADEFVMLENASRWIALFSGVSDAQVRGPLSATPYPANHVRHEVLHAERLLLDLMYALRDGRQTVADDTFQVLLANPVVSQKRSHILAVAKAVMDVNMSSADLPQSLSGLVSALRITVRAPSAESVIMMNVESVVFASVRTLTLLIRRGESRPEEVNSRSLTKLVAMFATSKSQDLRDVLAECFGLRRYDPTVHDAKLANFLSRANRALDPMCVFSRRGNQVVIRVAPQALVIEPTSAQTSLLQQNDILMDAIMGAVSCAEAARPPMVTTASEQRRSGASADLDIKASVTLPTGWVSRQALEAFLGVSRATAIRRITRWIETGELRRQGVGKASTYLITNEFQARLLAEKQGGFDEAR